MHPNVHGQAPPFLPCHLLLPFSLIVPRTPYSTWQVSMTATRSERGFHAVPHAISRTLGTLVCDLYAVPNLVASGATRELTKLCSNLAAALGEARSHLGRIYTEVSPSKRVPTG